jgi:hypothetical protein
MKKINASMLRFIMIILLPMAMPLMLSGQISDWQVFETIHPEDELLVAVHINDASGVEVDNTGTTDVTNSFQVAIDRVFNEGGGTIYVSAGTYRFHYSLTIHEGVSIRGDFVVPLDHQVAGTIFTVYGGRNNVAGEPFITIRGCASLNGVSIWYPEQTPENIVPYPITIKYLRNPNGRYSKHATMVTCVNLVNAYFGVEIGSVNLGIPFLTHIYGSPLHKGIFIDECSDVSRLIDIHFSPTFWATSGLEGAPEINGPHTAFMLEHGHAVDYLRSDNGFNGFWYISGYNIGASINESYSAGPFYNLEITGCKTALILRAINQVPACFTNCIFEGSEAALVLDEMTGTAQFQNSRFLSSGNSVKPGTNNFTASQVTFQNCIFGNTAHLSGRYVNIANSEFNFQGEHVIAGNTCNNLILMDNKYQGNKTIVNLMGGGGKILNRDTIKTYLSVPEFDYTPFFRYAPTRAVLYVATDYDGVIPNSGMDAAPGLQQVLYLAHAEGGGFVYLPAGEYTINSPIIIPENVELRGALDNPHHARLLMNRNLEHEFGSVLLIHHNRGNSFGATISLSASSGARGLSVYYPTQNFYETGFAAEFPWTFRLSGDNAYIKNICVVNPYQLADIAHVKSDNHYIENIIAFPLFRGIQVGKGSTDGIIRSVHYNNSTLGQTWFPTDNDKLADWAHAHMDLFRLGHVTNQEMLFCFGRQCRNGFVLDDVDGIGPHGIAIGFGVESITEGATIHVKQNNGFQFINASLLSESITINFETNSTLELFNSRTKTSPYFIKSHGKGGRLLLNQVLHRGDDTIIETGKDELEIVNSMFNSGLEFQTLNPDIPLVIYGSYLRTGQVVINSKQEEIFWNYLHDPMLAENHIKLNIDLFLSPGNYNHVPTNVKSIISNKTESHLICYPNPASGFVTIDYTKGTIEQLQIFNSTGRLVYDDINISIPIRIPTQHIGPSGIYFIQIIHNSTRERKTLIIQ